MGRSPDDFFAELLPIVIQTVERARETMRQAGDTAKTPNLHDDFLVITNNQFELKAEQVMGCNTGYCNMDVEEQLTNLLGWCDKNGWKGAMRMYKDPQRMDKIHEILQRNKPSMQRMVFMFFKKIWIVYIRKRP